MKGIKKKIKMCQKTHFVYKIEKKQKKRKQNGNHKRKSGLKNSGVVGMKRQP
jgi:hypothetical protein